MKNCAYLLIVGLILSLIFAGPAEAAKPFGFATGFFKKKETVEADPNKEYVLNELNGPWMICVMTFSGENAKNRAMELTYELRKRYKIEAFIYEKVFDHTKGVDVFEEMRQTQSRKKVSIASGNVTRDWAVLVGDFQRYDDKDINEMLTRIKSNAISPECLKRNPPDSSLAASVGESVKMERKKLRKEVQNNDAPLATAMKTTNPLLPPEYFTQNKQYLDDFIVKINTGSDAPYSLLQCRGKYSIMVAQFKGSIYIKPEEVEAIEAGKKNVKNKLQEGTEKAEKLCEALRKEGWTAFTFHDRNSSIVTIGEFNYLGEQLPNGVINYHDDIARIMRRCQGKQLEANTGISQVGYGNVKSGYGFKVQSINGISLLAQPIPIEVPKVRPKQSR